jgi:CRP-like cAMP-binding protein
VVNDKTIKNFHFFIGKPNEFFAEVAPLLKPYYFYQNDYIYHDGDIIRNMYFVAKGTVIFVMPQKYDETEIIMIKKNKNFGEVEMSLEEEIKYSIKIKSKACELYSLEKEHFNQLTINFKDIISEFLENSYQIFKMLKYKYYRIIKENRELELKIEKIIRKEQKMNKEFNKKISINLGKFNSVEDLYNAEDELSNEEKKEIKRNKKRRLSENTQQKISVLHLEDKKINEIIDQLILIIKNNKMEFPINDNPIAILNEIKEQSNNVENIEKIKRIEEMIYNYYSNENLNL